MIVEVAAGLIRDGSGRYLITRRREGTHLAGLWEFPGGKRHAGEDLRTCLARELSEELNGVFEVGEQVDTVRWEYADKTVVIHFFSCELRSGTIQPLESQAIQWAAPESLAEYRFPAADAALIARLLRRTP